MIPFVAVHGHKKVHGHGEEEEDLFVFNDTTGLLTAARLPAIPYLCPTAYAPTPSVCARTCVVVRFNSCVLMNISNMYVSINEVMWMHVRERGTKSLYRSF
jgi:hypothetical protein